MLLMHICCRNTACPGVSPFLGLHCHGGFSPTALGHSVVGITVKKHTAQQPLLPFELLAEAFMAP